MKYNLSEILRKKQLRLTETRKIIYEVLSKSQRSMSVQDISEVINNSSKLKINISSIYRNLLLFIELGLIHKLQGGKYSFCQQSVHHYQHIHIVAVCIDCKMTFEVGDHTDEVCHIANNVKSFLSSFTKISRLICEGHCHSCTEVS